MQTASDPYPLFHMINNAHTPAGDLFFGVLSGLGDGLVVALLCSLLMLFRLRLGIAALIAYLLSGLITQVIKHMFDMPRPPALLEHVHVLGSTLTSHSFPSGHATSDGVMLLVAFLLWSVKSWRSWSVGGLFVLAAIGRVYGGVHFPTDVMTGLGIGVVTMWILWRWSGSWPVERWLQSQWAWKIPGLIVAVEAAVLGLGYHMQPSTAQPLAVALPVAALMVLMHVWKERLAHEQ
ncbi:phosphatase PAP2 family protein [Mariprofundus ferrooxydans]|uniref:Phosphoesterase, PA-phosphatase related protein n=1 Tax=Mariprofundus ferrooxydans PV-1 TaxID=314345 RepID=Q0EY82_9PROT|nr:phosphatase PAP2 family protein [Mariprofundus ferrooxydans]EAU54310.1 Phosphoesterase, PA-phosphatase related protein [Mariprofundus ferrooxydans PV-1]KON48546.1 phosphoesterase [Mariprofundus ferrooxydans]